MPLLSQIADAVERYDRFVHDQIQSARTDPAAAEKLLHRWREIRSSIPTTTTPTGVTLPRLALPDTNEPTEIARYLYAEGLPGTFPFVNAAYREMYLASDEG